MIAVYHNIGLIARDENTVSLFVFILHLIYFILFKKVVPLEEYDATSKGQVVLRFDDGYRDFVRYALPVIKFFRSPCALFVCHKFIESANNGNRYFLNMSEIQKLQKCKFVTLHYHSYSHIDLSSIYDINILEKEISPPPLYK